MLLLLFHQLSVDIYTLVYHIKFRHISKGIDIFTHLVTFCKCIEYDLRIEYLLGLQWLLIPQGNTQLVIQHLQHQNILSIFLHHQHHAEPKIRKRLSFIPIMSFK